MLLDRTHVSESQIAEIPVTILSIQNLLRAEIRANGYFYVSENLFQPLAYAGRFPVILWGLRYGVFRSLTDKDSQENSP